MFFSFFSPFGLVVFLINLKISITQSRCKVDFHISEAWILSPTYKTCPLLYFSTESITWFLFIFRHWNLASQYKENQNPGIWRFWKVFFCAHIYLPVGLRSFQNSIVAESNVINCFGHFISNHSQEWLLIWHDPCPDFRAWNKMMVAGNINLIYQRGWEPFEKLYIAEIDFIFNFIYLFFSQQGNTHLS